MLLQRGSGGSGGSGCQNGTYFERVSHHVMIHSMSTAYQPQPLYLQGGINNIEIITSGEIVSPPKKQLI